ncbi:hypothetical protein TNCV_647501 [Trichonephila clavipes]|uniref:Uncharacterized protein n=1 Tax=Trichonephila clavipes TaxID=2585209 RepID=A0A8X6SUK8_TRICX|nr:hypothetical protein TNCV_647501 [Trichonephila clavipes]
MVSPAVQGQVPHPLIVPEFLRSTSCGMTSAHGQGAIVYCLNSGSEERQTGRHNRFCEGDTRNRWRDGQVCPDVDKELWRLGPDGSGVFWRWTSVFRCEQGTMAPWARRLGVFLACYVPIGRGRSRETLRKEEERGGGEEKRPERKKDKRVRERERTEGGGETEKRERRQKETERESGRERVKPALNGEKG